MNTTQWFKYWSCNGSKCRSTFGYRNSNRNKTGIGRLSPEIQANMIDQIDRMLFSIKFEAPYKSEWKLCRNERTHGKGSETSPASAKRPNIPHHDPAPLADSLHVDPGVFNGELGRCHREMRDAIVALHALLCPKPLRRVEVPHLRWPANVKSRSFPSASQGERTNATALLKKWGPRGLPSYHRYREGDAHLDSVVVCE